MLSPYAVVQLARLVRAGAQAVHQAVTALPRNAHPSEVLRAAGVAFSSANPSTYAALVGGGLLAAATAVTDTESFTAGELGAALAAFQGRIMERGGAQIGDKTVVDVIAPVTQLVQAQGGLPAADLAAEAARTAQAAVDAGTEKVSQRGRASWVGERSAGHQDPGSVAFLRLLEEIAKEL